MRKTRRGKLRRQKNIIVIGSFCMLLFFSVGYAAFSTTVRLNAKGNVKSNRLILNPNGGILDVTSKRVTKGKAYGNLPTPTREGYIFKGWNGKNKFNKEDYLKLEDYDIYTSYHIANISLKENTTYKVNVYRYNGFDGKDKGTLLINSTSPIYQGNWTAIAHQTFPTSEGKVYTTGNDGSLQIGYYNDVSQENMDYIWANTDVQIEEGTESTDYEPYYVTNETIVTQEGEHTLTAIWEEEPVEQTEP